jgi:hypothetical protein
MVTMSREGARSWLGVELPKHVIYLYRDDACGYSSGTKWEEYTIYDVVKEKVEKQNRRLVEKRRFSRRVPCYIYCFYNDSWIFGGWYVYIESLYGSFGLNGKGAIGNSEKILNKLMQGYLFFDEWCEDFCKRYPRQPMGIKTKIGKRLTHCILNEYNKLISIEI